MSSNVGLSTPRGSGTSGYVQRNLSHLKPRETFSPYPTDASLQSHKPRKPDQAILTHDRLREIEVKVFELRDELEDAEEDEEEIERRTEELRQELLKKEEEGKKGGGGGKREGNRQFKLHQVHEAAEAKILETERARKALGIRADYEEGSHWKGREGRLREGLAGGERDGGRR